MDPLTDADQAILDVERRWWPTAGDKDEAIRGLGLSPVRYYQRLNQIIEREAALECDAVTVRRLLRIRQSADLHSSP